MKEMRFEWQDLQQQLAHDGRFFINAHFMVTHGPRFEAKERIFTKGRTQNEAWAELLR